MAIDVAEAVIGACDVSFEGTDLGSTDAPCTVKYTQTLKEFQAQQSTMVGRVWPTLEAVEIKTPLSEHNLAKLRHVFPTGEYTLDGTKEKVELGGGLWDQTVDYGELILQPTGVPIVADDNHRYTIHKAYVSDVAEIGLDRENHRIVMVTWKAIEDTTKAAGNRLLTIGDTTAV